MGWAELFLLISVGLNYWTYGELSDAQTREASYRDAASACQAALSDNRATELKANDERTKKETAIRGVIARSKLNTRKLDKVDRNKCNGVSYPVATQRVLEHIKRTQNINQNWVRSPSVSDE